MGRAPLHGTVVALSGTPLSAEVDSLGRFRFDSIPPGAYTLLASHSTYADFGQLADDEPLTLEAGKEYTANMRAITTIQLRSMLCDVVRTEPPFGTTVTSTPDQAVVRILMLDADSGHYVTRFPLWLRWRDPGPAKGVDTLALLLQKDKQMGPVMRRLGISESSDDQMPGVQMMTDDAGGATFCGIPADTSLELLWFLQNANDVSNPAAVLPFRIGSFMLKKGEIVVRSFRVRPPR